MDEREVREKLGRAFRSVFADGGLPIEDAMTGWDSITYMNLIVAVEREFEISFTTREIHRMTDAGKFVQAIMARLRDRAQHSTTER
jgi:acyl carrier protein